jgi:hypothetical protein
MSQFPLNYNNQDSDNAVDAINYVLSGPSGLGQNFAGKSGYNITYLTGNFRAPYTLATVSVNALGGSGLSTITVDSVEGIKEGNYVMQNNITPGTKVAPGGIDIDTKVITLTNANTATVSGLVTFSDSEDAQLYVAPISLTSVVWISPFVVRINYPDQTPPFALGNPIRISGNSQSIYNYYYTGAGVIESTRTYSLVRSTRSIANPGTGTGGTATFYNTLQPPAGSDLPAPNDWVQTDCNAYATVTGPTDRVFISAQLDQVISYLAAANSDIRITVAINRYKVSNINDQLDPQYRNIFDATIAQRSYIRSVTTGSGTLSNIETTFSTFIDEPNPAYYNYRLEVLFRIVNATGSCQITTDKVDVRALSTQVVKQ